jgi:site-specific recombinase XerD
MKLQAALMQYLTLKKSLGFRFHAESQILAAFSQTMGKVDLSQVKPVVVRAYLDGPGQVTRNWSRKWEALRGFYRFALDRGLVSQVPLPNRPPKLDFVFTPYIYTQQELRRLLQAITPELTARLSPQTVRTLLLLLYGAALRISEALNLECDDVNLQTGILTVRHSKFFKTRLVPIGPKLTQVLRKYCPQRLARNSHRHFFCTRQGRPVSRSTIERVFGKLRQVANVKRTDGGRLQPRLHDLRHAAAVHRLVAWYRQGADVQSLLVRLSAYLGHVNIASTQQYLTVTPDLRAQASARFARYALGGAHE